MASAVGRTVCINFSYLLQQDVLSKYAQSFFIPPTQHEIDQPVAGFFAVTNGGKK